MPALVEANRTAFYGSSRFLFIRFERGPLSLPIEGSNLADLREFLEYHADPEVAMEVRVRDLVEAPDVGDNEIWVSTRLPDESVQALRAALGDNLRPS
jgi:hypothetical protein